MIISLILVVAFISFVLILYACGGSQDSGNNGSNDTSPPSSAAKITALPSNVTDTPTGGVLVETGIDGNGNGQLDDPEIETTEKACVDSSEADTAVGLGALLSQSLEPAGINCPRSGTRFDAGIDDNPINGTLDTSEITSTVYICETQPPPIPLSGKARLSGIQLSTGQLDQLFQSNQVDFTASVNYLTDRIHSVNRSEYSLAVGAPGDDDNGTASGSVYVFQ